MTDPQKICPPTERAYDNLPTNYGTNHHTTIGSPTSLPLLFYLTSAVPYLITMPYLYLRVTMTTYPPSDLLEMLALDHSD